jgi:hypothetical protein
MGYLRRLHVLLARASAWWLADRRPSSRHALLLAIAVHSLATLAGVVAVRSVVLPVLEARGPAEFPSDGTNGVRFGLAETLRRDIFREIASAEPAARARGAQSFPGEPWSMEDHRAAFERDTARGIAQRRELSLSQIYLILDEGIRQRWPGPGGAPLSAQSYPLAPRKR